MKTRWLIIFSFFTFISVSGQQLINSGALIQGGLEDGETLLRAYITPINKAIVFGLSDVTYTKTRREQKRKLFLSVKLAYISVPEKDFTYDLNKLDLKHLEAKDPNNSIAQTVFGDSLAYVMIASKDKKPFTGEPLFEFKSPTGGQKSALPLPYLGVTYRLKYTNISANLIPYIQVPTSDMKIGMFGLSLQQDMAMFIKELQGKNLGLSLQGGYAFMYGNAPLDVKPGGITSPVTITGSTTGPYDNQEVNIFYTSMSIGAYADYTLLDKFTIFAGAGYNSGTSRIQVNGTYPIYASDPAGLGSVVGEDIDDPIDMSDSFNRLKLEIGARADWDKFYLQLNYNFAEYGGFGLNLGYKML